MITFLAAALLASPVSSAPVAQRWTPPYESIPKPEGYEGYRIDAAGTGVFVEKGRLTFLSKGPENQIVLPDWMSMPFVRDEPANLWVAQASMKDWDRSFFTYTLKRDGRNTRTTFFGPRAPKPPTVAKTLQGTIQTLPFPSKELGESRNLMVYLPPNPGPNLNAIYMADGQSCQSFAKILEPLILAKRIAPTAIIGLFHGEYKGEMTNYDMSKDFRAREYLKVADPDRFESHLRFVTQEVMPWAEGKFGLMPDAKHRALFGFSNGAAFALVASVECPNLFANVLPFSVAAYDADELRKSVQNKELPHYWLAAGTLESFVRNTKAVEATLKEVHAKVRMDSYVSGHDEAMWQIAFAKFLPRCFPPARN